MRLIDWTETDKKYLSNKNEKDENLTKNLYKEENSDISYNINALNSFKRYSLITILFIGGFMLVSAVKNETRNLEKEISYLRESNKIAKFNLNQAILDNQVITSPENISYLAKEYLNTKFVFYKKSQISKLGEEKIFLEDEKNTKNTLSENVKIGIRKKIQKKKKEIKKLQELYAKPESIPGEVKTQVAKKIEQKKNELKELYSSPKDKTSLFKMKKWAAVQVAKVFLGIPVVPGR